MSKNEKLAALIADLLKVAEKHKMVVDKYAKAMDQLSITSSSSLKMWK